MGMNQEDKRTVDEWCKMLGIMQYDDLAVEENDMEGEYEDVQL